MAEGSLVRSADRWLRIAQIFELDDEPSVVTQTISGAARVAWVQQSLDARGGLRAG